jgi:hypothetical protein
VRRLLIADGARERDSDGDVGHTLVRALREPRAPSGPDEHTSQCNIKASTGRVILLTDGY